MTVSTIKCRIDAFSNESFPGRPYGTSQILKIGADTGAVKRAYLHFTIPDVVMRGANLTSALLRFTPRNTLGSTTGEIRRLVDSWREGGITFNNAPTTSATNAVAFTELWEDEIEADVTDLISDAVSAGEFRGFRITTTATTVREIHSSEAPADVRPTLQLTWSKAPLAPDDLRPSGTRSVSSSSPRLSWAFRSSLGDSSQSGYEVEVRNASTLASIEDTGEVVSSDAFHDVAATLVVATTYEWRVRAQDGDGLWSEFSEWVEFEYVGVGTVTITNPGVSEVVNDTTPPLTWTYSGTQEEAEVTVFVKNLAGVYKPLHTLTRRVYAPTSYTPPQGVIKSQAVEHYKVRVRVWPDEDLEDIAGAPSYAEAERVFSFELTTDVTPPATLTATPHAIQPRVDLTWTRATGPDEFLLLVDDEVVVELDPAEVFVSGTSYAYSYWAAIPDIEHTYQITAVVDNEASDTNPTDDAVISPIGIWLVDPETETLVYLAGQDEASETRGRSEEIVYPIGRLSPVRTRDALRGYEGSHGGILTAWNGVSADEYRDALRLLDEQQGSVRYVYADRNIPVRISDVACPPMTGFPRAYAASFSFEQVGEFE